MNESENVTIGVIGATGHFGEVITKRLVNEMPECRFISLGRKPPVINHPNLSFKYFDYEKDSTLPDTETRMFLILDLTGPIKSTDGKCLTLAIKSKTPYMDIALHNSHMELINKIYNTNSSITVFPHYGFFPGLSNLMISKGFEIAGANSGILANEFPSYAGGGKHVAVSLKDMLNESKLQKNIKDNKNIFFQMHSKSKKLLWNKKVRTFYQWEYPEINSFLHSWGNIDTLERYVSIKPSFLNLPFSIMVKLWNTPLHYILAKFLPTVVFLIKRTIFRKVEPTMTMKFYSAINNKCLINLKVKSAVQFHGLVMVKFLKCLIQKELRHGVYTPEQMFSLDDILDAGVYEEYELTYSD